MRRLSFFMASLLPIVFAQVFDPQSYFIGAVAVALSGPNTIYVGSGEGFERPDLSVGGGMHKTTGGGKTWRHLGLRDGQRIPAIPVDPRHPNGVFVAVLGHPYGPNAERRSEMVPGRPASYACAYVDFRLAPPAAMTEAGGVAGSVRASLAYAGECKQTRADEAPRRWLGGSGSTFTAPTL